MAREKDDEGRSQSLGSENRANEGSGERLRLKGAVRRVWSVENASLYAKINSRWKNKDKDLI